MIFRDRARHTIRVPLYPRTRTNPTTRHLAEALASRCFYRIGALEVTIKLLRRSYRITRLVNAGTVDVPSAEGCASLTGVDGIAGADNFGTRRPVSTARRS